MQQHSLKQDAMETLARLPEDVDIDEIMYRLHLVDKLRKSRAAIAAGETIRHDDLRKEIEQWT